MSLSAEELKALVSYDPETGIFRYLQSWNSRTPKGAEAGTLHKSGYRSLSIHRRKYYAHRLAWFYMTGEWPSGMVDHINGCRSDNRWENLRLADYSQNMANSRTERRNGSGLKGLSWDRERQKWRASIMHQGKGRFIGRFNTREEAVAAYRAKAKELFGEFARGE